MPIMNGLEAVKQIRLLESEGTLKKRVPVIGVTANVRQQQIQTAIGAGMDDVVGKPFKVAELLVRMEDIVKDTTVDPDAFGLGITSGFEQEGML
jgi:CheY-like chemotaxis protein